MNNTLASTVQPFVDQHHIAGAVTLVADREAILDVTCVGYADVANRRPMTPDTMFWIASTTKPMTAAALFMLVEEGRVCTNDPVEKYLPEFRDMWWATPVSDDRRELNKCVRSITLHNLLTHSSGLPFLSKLEPPIDGRPLREVVASAASAVLQAAPGTCYIYSNAGSNTIGRVIEVVSGMPYEQFMQERLFDPLGMSDTTFFPSPGQLSRLAKVYGPDDAAAGLTERSLDQYLNPFSTAPRYAAPGGGLFASAADVARFAQMILRGGCVGNRQLLTRDSVRRLTSVQSVLPGDGAPKPTGYHFATTAPFIADGPAPAGPCGHGGAFGNDMWIEPEAGLVLVWMVQRSGPPPATGPSALQTFREKAVAMAQSRSNVGSLKPA